MKKGFIQFVQEQLQVNSIDAHYIQFEISESTILKIVQV